jgi:cellulose synthase/poly-beta-1,6-N-acetylglucosamine synthase-like glycosyltransferase
MFMGVLGYILIVMIAAQILFTIQVINNYRYAMQKSERQRTAYRPECVLIVPCKGLDEAFDTNIASFFGQDYQPYHLWFVVQDTSDLAYNHLMERVDRLASSDGPRSVKVMVAGRADSCSQKLHNLLFAYQHIPSETEVLVFADSDACAGPDWLAHIVYPLRKEKNGASGGYRCFVPGKNNLATLALASVNAKICQLLGNTRFNLAWGGSMAIAVKTFQELKIDKIWAKALSDDLSLSAAVRKVGRKMVFVPACMIASYETTTWPKFWEFARRQFVITRIYAPGMWLFGLFSAVFAVAGLWGSAALAVWAIKTGHPFVKLCIAVPAVFGGCQLFRTILRQKMIAALLPADKKRLKTARWADILGFWFWAILMLLVILSSAAGRVITWRGIRYRLNSPTDISVLDMAQSL